jgi:hypothetical protein
MVVARRVMMCLLMMMLKAGQRHTAAPGDWCIPGQGNDKTWSEQAIL